MKIKLIVALSFLGIYSSNLGQIDLSMVQIIEPVNDTLDFSVEYTDGCFSPQAHIFTNGSGTVNSDEIMVCWVINNGTPNCNPYETISFQIGWGMNLQTSYWDTICINQCQTIDLMCYVNHPNDPNQSNDTLRITLQDDCNNLGTSNFIKEFVKIYPNPVNNDLNVELSQNADFLNVLSADGRIIHTIKHPKNKIKINLDLYNPGIYLIQITSDKKQYTSKFIKQ